MASISVNTGKPYKVQIEAGIRHRIGEILSARGWHGKIALLSDDLVLALHGKAVKDSLSNSGFKVVEYAFPNGEKSKNMQTVSSILEFMAASQLTRSDLVVALGGGVVGDIAGFCAAIYLRGISFVQMPTTLLAAIDSSVGGKTGVDLSAGKNLAGAFWQPEVVFCDKEMIDTLPLEIFNEGVAEAIKYAVIADKELFDLLSAGRLQEELERVIARCVQIKSDVVSEDEFDRGRRQLLNFGHTIGHAIEKCANFTLSHGHAVAAGMVMIADIAWRNGWSVENCAPPIRQALEIFHLPTSSPYEFKSLTAAMLSDKKRQGETISIVVPQQIGKASLKKLAITELERL
ncbi:MAG: 3-dehydroquinate synthase [Porticoccaceae bacterium]|nr:3-dehydroquinate synthase [Porticoccaceae bacterium]